MPNNNYRRGATFERKIKKQWEDDGYLVIRSAGSKGPVDLVAIKSTAVYEVHVVLIQCKLRKPTAAERRKAKEAGEKYQLQIVIVWPDGQEVL